MIEINNDYSYMKSTRFNLYVESGQFSHISANADFDSQKFIFHAREILKIKNYLFEKDKQGNFVKKNDKYLLFKLVTIFKRWKKIYSKFEAYTKKNEQTENIIYSAIIDFERIITDFERINNANITPDKQNLRNSEFNNIIIELSSKRVYILIKDLINFGFKHKNLDFDFKEILNNFEFQLNCAKKQFLSSSSFGIEISRGSMNYYTINKDTKYLDSKVIDNLNALKDQIFLKINLENKKLNIGNHEYNKEDRSKSKKIDYNYDLTDNDITLIKSFCDVKSCDLNETSKFVKLYKAEMKSKLLEDCNKKTLEELKNYSFLFNDYSKLSNVYELTKEIKKANYLKDDKKVMELKNERGKYFFVEDDLCFKGWSQFNVAYSKIKRYLGEINTKTRNYEREKYESQLLNYWCLFYKNNDSYYILFVPKEKRSIIREYLSNCNVSKENKNLFLIKSLTKRSLDKLCFNENGSFFKEMPQNFQNMVKDINKAGKRNTNAILNFFKDFLDNDYIRKKLDLEGFDLSWIEGVLDLKDFEKKLETNCYKVFPYNISEIELNKLIVDNKIIKCRISSYDLEKRNKDIFQTPISEQKRHTKELWYKFWQNPEGDTRLNPEVRVYFKERDSHMKDYLINNLGIIESKLVNRKGVYNRNLEDKYLIGLSFLLNPGKYNNLAYCKTSDLIENVLEFNEKLNGVIKNDAYIYGIDVGERELASLLMTKFNDKNTYNFDQKIILHPFFPNPEILKIYCLNRNKFDSFEMPSNKLVNFVDIRKRNVLKNISYFIDKADDCEWFETKDVASIDLTCAKVIKGKIIENGDVLTYLQYLKKVAKRLLFEKYMSNELDLNTCSLLWDGSNDYKNDLCLCNDAIKIKIYSFRYEYNGIILETDKDNNPILKYTKENIKTCFEKYIDELKNNNITIPQLNNLRDALVSNMVGVIFHLQKYFPGYVFMENDLSKSQEDKYIIKRLELALYKKYQTLGLVPPHIKNMCELKDLLMKKNKDLVQIGVVGFVKEEGTSKICPYCETKNNDPDLFDSAKKEGTFVCPICKFDTSKTNNNFKVINDCDLVASYNIAKRGYKELIKWKKT